MKGGRAMELLLVIAGPLRLRLLRDWVVRTIRRWW